MKKVALAAALSLAATSSYAGSLGGKLADPVIEPPVIMQETSSSANILVPLLLLILVAAAIASR